jgi:hypothetical protein
MFTRIGLPQLLVIVAVIFVRIIYTQRLRF